MQWFEKFLSARLISEVKKKSFNGILVKIWYLVFVELDVRLSFIVSILFTGKCIKFSSAMYSLLIPVTKTNKH